MKNKESRDGLLTLVSITGVNALNYGLNLVLGRFLGPEGFAQANILATIVLILSFMGVAVQMTSAQHIAQKTDDHAAQEGFKAWYNRSVLWLSLAVTAIGVLLSFVLPGYLHMEQLPLLMIFIGIPFYFHLCAQRGYFQGAQRFLPFSMTFITETVGRLVVTLGGLYLAHLYAPEYKILAVGLGFLFSFLISFAYTRWQDSSGITLMDIEIPKKTLFRFVIAISLYELSQILINNCDVILVKHFFDEHRAGMYASIALIGRIVYFGTWTIVTLLFPKVIEKEMKGESHTGLFYGSLAIVLGCGAVITFMCFWQGALIMQLLFGDAYADAAPLLWRYALSTTVFAGANVFAYYYMSLKKYLPVAISLIAGILQISVINYLHSSIEMVINVQIVLMSSLLLIMLVYHMIHNMRGATAPKAVVA